MPEVHDAESAELDGRAYSWLIRGLYVTLISAELWLVFDLWRETPSGQVTIERWRRKLAEAKERAENCEGCARRRAMIRAAVNRMQWQAERIVEGDDVPTQPEPPAAT